MVIKRFGLFILLAIFVVALAGCEEGYDTEEDEIFEVDENFDEVDDVEINPAIAQDVEKGQNAFICRKACNRLVRLEDQLRCFKACLDDLEGL